MRVNKIFFVVRVVYIMNMKNEYWYEIREIKNINLGEGVLLFFIISFYFCFLDRLDWVGF